MDSKDDFVTPPRPSIRFLLRRASECGLSNTREYHSIVILRDMVDRYQHACMSLYGMTLIQEGRSVEDARRITCISEPWPGDFDSGASGLEDGEE